VIERQRQGADLSHGELSIEHPRRILDLPEREDRSLAGSQDGRAGVDAEYADIGNRDRPAAQIGRRCLASAGRDGQLADGAGEIGQRQRVGP